MLLPSIHSKMHRIDFWLFFHLYMLTISIVFFIGRKNKRHSERFDVNLPVTIKIDEREMEAITSDISEGGMAIIMENAEFIPYDQPINVKITYKDYSAEMSLKLLYTKYLNETWVYSFQLVDITEENKQEYYEIIFDRDHTHAKEMTSNMVEEARKTLRNVAADPILHRRKLPRFDINKIVIVKGVGDLELITFNYEYIEIKNNGELPRHINLPLFNNFTLICNRDFNIVKEDSVLYKVENWQKIAADPAFHRSLIETLKDGSYSYFLVNRKRKEKLTSKR